MPDKTNQSKPADNKADGRMITKVADRIRNSENVLVALSKNPSVDELTAALGLTFALDKLGKHATAIFSGAVPNAIEFLEPEKTFESNTNSLQDFIIALDKEKADHLRYKVEGDYVRVFITPYRTTIDENDLEFSHGDYNVDLVIAVNVDAESDLDSALSEYGKIKHDASSINISVSEPGKFADLEWSEVGSSSVSEMVANLADYLDDGSTKEKLIDKSTATALLAGIVSATNHFSNERTSPDTMTIAAKLMKDGADQQLISSSISKDMLEGNVVDMSGEVEDFEVINHDEASAAETAPAAPEAAPAAEEAAPATEAPAAPAPEAPAAPVAEATIPAQEEELSAKKPDNVPDLPSPESSPIAPDDATPTTQAEASVIETTAVPAPAEAEPVPIPTPELEPLAEPATTDAPADAVPVVPADQVEPVAEAAATPPTTLFQPSADPAQPPVQPADQNANSEFVAPPLPMPSDGSILPPPPAPFDLNESTPNAEAPAPVTEEIAPVSFSDATASAPSAQDFVQNIQDSMGPNSGATFDSAAPVEPIMPAPQLPVEESTTPELAPNPSEAPLPAATSDSTAPIQPAYLQNLNESQPEPAENPNIASTEPPAQAPSYNSDPGAFQIPGM